MDTHPKISIITVVYNNAGTVEDTIRSVLSQDYPDIEYLIIDGESSDGTLGVIEKYRDQIDTFVSEKDKGMYDALNKGIRLATGDIVGILHSDDLFAHEAVVRNIARTFDIYDTDSVYADLVYVDKENPDLMVRKWKSGSYKKKNFLWGWMPPHPTFYVRKTFFKRYGYYNPSFKSAADYELMLRFLYKHSVSSHYLEDTLVKMRVGGKSNESMHARLEANKQDYRAWKVNNLKPRFYTRFLKPLRKIPQFLGY